jgi:hypothetical protein
MATYEQAMEALRKADAEGNVEDAQKLAEIATRLRPDGAGGGRGLQGGPTAEGKARAATGLGELLYESVKKGVTQPFARATAGSAMQTGTFAGAFPTQPELEPITTESVQRGMGVDTGIRPATGTQRYLAAGVEALADPTNLIGLPVTTAGRLALGAGSTMAGIGGEFGGEVGKQVGGVTGQVTGGILFALLSGAGATKGVGLMAEAKNRVNLKDFNVEDLAGVEGTSQAQDLIKRALDADPNLTKRLEDIRKKIAFVGGKPDILAAGAIDNKVLETGLKDLVTKDAKIANDLEIIYKDLQTAVRTKATELYPQPSVEIPKASTQIGKVEIDYVKRLQALSDQQAKLTQSLNLAGNISPVDIGKPIQGVVLAQEAAARNALSPEYESVKKQASQLGAILPANETQALLNTAKDLFMQDPWGRQSDLLKLVQKQSGEFSRMRKQGQVDTTLPAVPGQAPPVDLSIGMDITSLDSLKRRVAADIRSVKNDATKDKLILLQQRVDEALDRVQNTSGDINVNFRGEKTTFGNAMSQLDLDYYNKVGIPFKDADAIQKIGSQEYAERIAPQLAKSPTAMTQFLKVAGDEGMPLAEKAVMSKLYNSALDKDGYIDPTKLNALITKTSNNGGYSDILAQLPGLKSRLDDVTNRANILSSERVALDDAAKAERIRIGDSFLANYETGGVDAITSRMLGSTGKGYQTKFFNDLKKLSPDDQTNTTLAVQNALVTKMLDSQNPFAYLEKNKDAFVRLFGKQHFDNLSSLADVQRLATKIDVNSLPLDQAAIKEMGTLQRLLGGVDPKRVSAILVNQIASVFNKGFRIAAAVGQKNIDDATKEAHRKLFMDKGGLDGVIKASTRLINKKGQEVELSDFVKPGDLSNFANSLGMSVMRTGYLGGSVAASPSEVIAPEPESSYQYTPMVQ